MITRNRTVLDGYARLEWARLQGRITLPCIEYELSEEEALHWLIQMHLRSDGLNAFCRILLALELEPWLKEKACSNQRAGGQHKGSSNLTEAEKLDVRSEIAAAAGVSVGNVSKVTQLKMSAAPELLNALLSGEISIHRAWVWSKASPKRQLEKLRLHHGEQGIKKTIRTLVSRHRSKSARTALDLGPMTAADLGVRLSAMDARKLVPVTVQRIKVPGTAAFLSEDLFHALTTQKELPSPCATDSH